MKQTFWPNLLKLFCFYDTFFELIIKRMTFATRKNFQVAQLTRCKHFYELICNETFRSSDLSRRQLATKKAKHSARRMLNAFVRRDDRRKASRWMKSKVPSNWWSWKTPPTMEMWVEVKNINQAFFFSSDLSMIKPTLLSLFLSFVLL